MKIIIAPDSFKGSIASMDAAIAIERALKEVDPTVETALYPMADGGEGTVDAFLWSKGGEKIFCDVQDPFGRNIHANYGWIEYEKTAVIETAAASGLPLLEKWELDPEKATSYGTGQLINDALERGAENIILGLGGSATVDVGTGLFQALGMKFLDNENNEVKQIGGRLEQISSIDVTGLSPKLALVKLIVASDVSNPLLGEKGAITIFGPQKGVKKEEIDIFEERVRAFSEIAVRSAGKDMRDEPGSGAAGGIGFMIKTFLNSDFQSGLELMVDTIGLEESIAGADLVLTGEGRIDGQSLFGKVPVGLARLARKNNIPVIAFTGSIGPGIENLDQQGIKVVLPITDGPQSLDEALMNGEQLLYQAAKRLMHIIQLGKNLKVH